MRDRAPPKMDGGPACRRRGPGRCMSMSTLPAQTARAAPRKKRSGGGQPLALRPCRRRCGSRRPTTGGRRPREVEGQPLFDAVLLPGDLERPVGGVARVRRARRHRGRRAVNDKPVGDDREDRRHAGRRRRSTSERRSRAVSDGAVRRRRREHRRPAARTGGRPTAANPTQRARWWPRAATMLGGDRDVGPDGRPARARSRGRPGRWHRCRMASATRRQSAQSAQVCLERGVVGRLERAVQGRGREPTRGVVVDHGRTSVDLEPLAQAEPGATQQGRASRARSDRWPPRSRGR